MPNNEESSHYKQAVFLCGIAIVAYLLKFTFNAFLAQHLSKAEYGDFSIGLQTFMLASSLLLMGTGTAAKRFLSSFLKNNSQTGVHDYIAWNIRLVWGISTIFLLALLVIVLGMLMAHLFDIRRIENYHIAIYLLLFSPIGAAIMLLNSYLLCNSNIYWSNFLQNAGRFVLFVPMVWVTIYFFDIALDTKTLLSIIVLSSIGLLIFETILLLFKAPTLAKNIFARKKSANIDLAWKQTSLRLISSQVIYSILVATDLYIVEIFGRNEHSVGEYAALLIITGVSQVLSASICSFVTPLISPYLNTDKPLLQKAIHQATLINLLVNFIVMLLIGVFLKQVLSFFGPTYYNPTTIAAFIFLSSGFFIRSLSTIPSQLLAYSGNERTLIIANAMEFVAVIIFGIIATRWYGIAGLAAVVGCVVTIRTVYFCWSTHKKLGYNTIGTF